MIVSVKRDAREVRFSCGELEEEMSFQKRGKWEMQFGAISLVLNWKTGAEDRIPA